MPLGRDVWGSREPRDCEEIKRVIYEHARELREKHGLDVEVNERVINAICVMYRRHGKPYCPCRFERNENTICPCVYHVEELKRYGYCKCRLYVLKKN